MVDGAQLLQVAQPLELGRVNDAHAEAVKVHVAVDRVVEHFARYRPPACFRTVCAVHSRLCNTRTPKCTAPGRRARATGQPPRSTNRRTQKCTRKHGTGIYATQGRVRIKSVHHTPDVPLLLATCGSRTAYGFRRRIAYACCHFKARWKMWHRIFYLRNTWSSIVCTPTRTTTRLLNGSATGGGP